VIFGLGDSAFQGTGTPDSVLRILSYAVLDPEWNEGRIIMHQSSITGKKNFIAKGYYANFRVIVNLHKYTNPSASFNTFMTYLHQLVYFKPHVDGAVKGDGLGKFIRNETDTANQTYFLSDIIPFYRNGINKLDTLKFNFIASNYVDITKTVQ